jgi:hypothetical protein
LLQILDLNLKPHHGQIAQIPSPFPLIILEKSSVIIVTDNSLP